MRAQPSIISVVHQIFEQYERYIRLKINELAIPHVNNNKTYILYVSYGTKENRARVEHVITDRLDRAISRLQDKLMKQIRAKRIEPTLFKFDLVTNVESVPFTSLEEEIKSTRRYYFRKGISFDKEFRISFLEEEINANVFIRYDKNKQLKIYPNHINLYMKQRYPNAMPFNYLVYKVKNPDVYLFDTHSVSISSDDFQLYELFNHTLMNGVRKVTNKNTEYRQIVKRSALYLSNQLQDNQKFNYGYYAPFVKGVPNYNILRHSLTIYAMLEAYRICNEGLLVSTSEKALEYLKNQAITYKDNCAYIIEETKEKEIKLGAMAVGVLAFTKYMEITNSEQYLEIAEALVRGIQSMYDEKENTFIHVLHYPELSIKEQSRIDCYDSESIFAIISLYKLNHDEQLLEFSRKLLDSYIVNERWRNHDHWLSYAVNEWINFIPEDSYIIFGLQNCNDRLYSMYEEETTSPNYLELIANTKQIVEKIKKWNKHELLSYIDIDLLQKTADIRADYQRSGFYYPEITMYMKTPKILNDGFFIRQDTFRSRIDDIAHNILGYVHYLEA